jgi:hypothetical protein
MMARGASTFAVPFPTVATEVDFDELSWHDALIRRIEFRTPDFEFGDDTADLGLGLDTITNRMCTPDGTGSLEYSPATLVFHSVTDLSINVEWERSGHQMGLHDLSIHDIERVQQAVADQRVHAGQPYYLWRIVTNWPQGEIGFGAADDQPKPERPTAGHVGKCRSEAGRSANRDAAALERV